MEMLALIDNPHLKLPPVIHIAGTNGKGSTISFIKQILLEHKLKICCFTTPHILEFNESFVVNNENLTDQQMQQQKMGMIMAIIFPLLFYRFPSGLNLYWLSSSALQIIQQWYMLKQQQKNAKDTREIIVKPKKK